MRKVHLYVDGSYNKSTKEYGSGAVVVDPSTNKEIQSFSTKGSDELLATMHNVAGETMAVTTGLTLLKINYPDLKEVVIFYDYVGIEAWVTEKWRAKKPGSIQYKQSMLNLTKGLNVQFKKVKAHSGDHFNDRADTEAKRSIGLI